MIQLRYICIRRDEDVKLLVCILFSTILQNNCHRDMRDSNEETHFSCRLQHTNPSRCILMIIMSFFLHLHHFKSFKWSDLRHLNRILNKHWCFHYLMFKSTLCMQKGWQLQFKCFSLPHQIIRIQRKVILFLLMKNKCLNICILTKKKFYLFQDYVLLK